jgi:VCBS repeat-containing protein
LINQSTLTISGVLSLAADSIVDNSGTIGVGGLMEVLNTSVLQNSGLITLANGGDFKDHSTISNTITGTIDVTGGTLNVQVDIANSGHVTVDSGAKLALASAAIDGGIVTNTGEIDLTGGAVLKNGSLGNSGHIKVSGSGNVLHNEKVTANSALEIIAAGALLLDLGTTVANGGTVTVDDTATLTLNSASIDGGTVADNAIGIIDLTGNAVLKNGALANAGKINVSGTGNKLDSETVTNTNGLLNVTGTLILELGTLITGGILTNSGLVQIESVSGATLDGVSVENAGIIQVDTPILSYDGNLVVDDGTTITGGTLTIGHYGLFEVETDLGATLNGVSVGSSGVVLVDADSVLNLTGTTITGGTVTDSGTIHVTGNSAIDSAAVSGGHITVDAGKILTLDGTTVTNTAIADNGTVKVDSSDTLHLSGVTLTGGAVTVGTQGLIVTGGSDTFSGTHVSNDGTIEVHDGTLKITGSITGSGSVQIDSGAVFDLDGSDTQDVVFAGTGAELEIDAATFGGKIAGLAATDELDLRTIGYSAAGTTGTYVGNANGGVLTITDGSKSISMTLVGDYLHAHFAGASDGHGGTLITLNAADDAPAFVAAEKNQSATVTELSLTTSSSAQDPLPAVTGAIHFTDIDLTDRPAATITHQSVTWTDHLTDLSSSLTTDEIGALECALSLVQTNNTNSGAIGWSYSITDSALDFLADGQTATIVSTVTLNDNEGGTDTATVTITVTGSNDAPAIVGETDPATQTVVVVNPVVPIVLAQGVNTNSLGLHTETFNDQSPGSSSNNGQGFGKFDSEALDATFSGSGHAGVVNGSSSVSAAPFVGPLPGSADTTNYLSVGAGGTETITFDDEQNAFGLYWGSVDSYNTISFYHGETLVASYTGADVTPLFPTGNQGSFSSNGYVEFAGLASFDKVVLTSSSNAFEIDNISAGSVPAPHVELAAPITGTLTVSDADIGDTLTASVIGNAVLEYNGSTTIPGNIDVSGLIASKAIKFDSVKSDGGADVLHWTYDPTNPNLDFLKSGDTLTITYAAQVNDGHGNIGSQPLTVTIAGTNESANLSQFQVVNGTSQNDTFNNVGNHETIFGAGGHDTFVFKPGFGSVTIGDFDVNNDTINIDHTLVDHGLVTSLSAFLASAQSANSGQDTILTDANHDTIKLAGVTVAQLQAHPNDFHLT